MELKIQLCKSPVAVRVWNSQGSSEKEDVSTCHHHSNCTLWTSVAFFGGRCYLQFSFVTEMPLSSSYDETKAPEMMTSESPPISRKLRPHRKQERRRSKSVSNSTHRSEPTSFAVLQKEPKSKSRSIEHEKVSFFRKGMMMHDYFWILH